MNKVRHEHNWHALTSDEVLSVMQATSKGLSDSEAQTRLHIYGPNSLPTQARRSFLKRFFLQFHNVLIYVLLGAAITTAVLAHYTDSLVILAVVIVNAIIGLVQEGKAEDAMDALRKMLAPRAPVLRDGQRQTIDGTLVVPGDIVLLEAGDKVPADLRILKERGLQCQEAILTGESMPSEKRSDPVDLDAALGDRYCMAFSGTIVTSGQGIGVVVGTGKSTEIGRISNLLLEIETLETPLVKQMSVFSKWLTLLILAIASLILLFGFYVQHLEFSELFMAVVGLSVAAIPEGLPAVLTITLAIGVQAMARRHAIVRRLPAIETLGSVSVICTDKTGTLTQNEMVVASAITHAGQYFVEGVGYDPKGEIKRKSGKQKTEDYAALQELGRAALLCNEAVLLNQDGIWSVEGDPMEGALLAFAGKTGLESADEHNRWVRTDAIPFDAEHRFMATLHHDHDGNSCIYVKGAPERIMGMCRDQRLLLGQTTDLSITYWQEQENSMTSQGQRLLALAISRVDPGYTVLNHADLDGTLTFLGLVGLIDPPRPEAISAIAACYAAGIQVKMITGDHPGTAVAIGKKIGLVDFEKVLTGNNLDTMNDAELASQVLSTNIFARTSPVHKLRLVTALQAHGITVAMTGDGVNDAPALKRADTGIAMGKRGSEAAKEASDIVLADDNFASIVAAVREGRTVYDNIKKVLSWTLPTSAGEALTIVVALLAGMTLPITPIQILWVNLITASTLGIALAFEPTEENTMRRPPRRRNDSILSGELTWHIVFVSLLFLGGVFGMYAYAIDRGYPVELARTIVVNTLVVMEIFHLFFIRNIYGTSLTWKTVRGTRVVWATVGIITIAQFAITYIPTLQSIFNTAPVPFLDGVLCVGVGIAFFVIVEIEKQLRLRITNSGEH